MVRTAAVGAALLLGLTGCVSAEAPQAESAAGVVDPGAPTAAESCDLLSTESLATRLGEQFSPPIVKPDTAAGTVQCQWTASSQTAMVLTTEIRAEGPFFYRESEQNARRTLGPVVAAEIPGADSAYQVPSQGLTGMLVDGKYVEVLVLVPTATAKDVAAVAAQAAGNV